MLFYEEENPWSPWLSKQNPGLFAHPSSPAGGTGYGFSRKPGVLTSGLRPRLAPDPHSPAGRAVTPWEAAKGYAEYEFTKIKNRIEHAWTWEGVREAAELALGPKSFGLGVAYGIVKNPLVSLAGIVQLQKVFIEADLYERLTGRTSWKTVLSHSWVLGAPALWQLAEVTLIKADLLHVEELKRSYDMREGLISEVKNIFAHPVEFFEKVKGQMKAGYVEKWNRFCLLQKQTDLKSQFEAGEIFGDVLAEVVMLILTAISVGGAAAKLAAKIPQLVKVAEFIKGARAYEAAGGLAGEAGSAGEAAEEAKAATKTAEAVPKEAAESTVLRVATPYGPAIQSDAPAALAARSQVEGGATLYRIGTMGKSAAGEAQFWSLENPLSPGYAARYGIPAENVSAADFLEAATLKPGSPFVTRVAPGVGANGGGAIEAVVEPGGVTLQTFSTGTPGSP